MERDGETTYARTCHVCGETYPAPIPMPLENGKPPLGCCGPCGRQEYGPEELKHPWEDDGGPGEGDA